MLMLNEIKEIEAQKQLSKIKEDDEFKSKLTAEKKENLTKHHQELKAKLKEREGYRKQLKQEWSEIDKMGIAKWRLSNLQSIEEAKKQTITSSTNPADDMELAYAHVRYQKSFDKEENELRHRKYTQMKEARQQRLKPLASLGIKKFSVQYEKIKKNVFDKIHEERIQNELSKGRYVHPSYSKIGVD